MKFKQLLTKSLLAAVCLLAGQSVWGATGDVTTNAKIDFSNAITGTNPYTIAGEVGSMTWTRQWTYAPAISDDGYLLFGNMDSDPLSGAIVELQNANIRAKDKVTISFELAFSKLNNKHIGFQLLDSENNSLFQQLFDAYNGDFDNANPLNLDWSKMYRGSNEIIWDRRVSFTIEFDYAAKKVTTTTGCYLQGRGNGKTETSGTFEAAWTTTTPIAKFVLTGNLNNSGRPSALDNLVITTTEGNNSSVDANYTVKYMCGQAEIKDADVRSGEVNSSISLFSSDKESFTSGQERYIYVEDDAEGKTVSSNGTTVVTVTFRKANKYNYTVTSSYDNNPLVFGYSGSVWEDQNTITINYPRYQVYNNTTLVGKKPNGNDLTQSATIDSNDKIVNVEYSALDTPINDLYLFTEAENIQGLNASYPSGLASRISNKGMATGTSGTLLNLPAGRYKVTVGLSGGAGNTFTVKVNAGEDEIISGNCTANTIQEFPSEEFTLAKSTDITFTNTVNNSGRGIDFVYVQGESSSTIIGNKDYTTAELGDMTNKVILKPGDAYHYNFVNHNGGAADNSYNWMLPVYDANNALQLKLRADRYDTEGNPARGWTGWSISDNWDWENFNAEMDGATVDLNVAYSGSNVFTMNCTITTANEAEWTLSYNSADAGATLTGNVQVALAVNKSWLEVLTENQTAVGVTTTAAGKGWATLYTDKGLDFSNVDGLTAYTATIDNSTVKLIKVDDIQANTGVVLKSSTEDANTTYSIPVFASSSTNPGALLGSVTEAKDATMENPIYILKLNTNYEAQFKRATTGSLDAGKAYLVIGNGLAKALSVVFANDPTGIATVNASEVAQPAKRIVNGQLVIEKNGKRYNAAGAEF